MSPIELPDWSRAHGSPLFAARLRTVPQDFQVSEQLGWEFSGDGEHDYLWIEKTDANTEWVARQLASHAGVPAKDVGYAGLKDRHAVTLQWFSVPRWNAPVWGELDIEGVRIIDVQRHLRKLRRGAHRANTFRITLRLDAGPDADGVAKRLAMIRKDGVPNYFGEQRFGREGGNLRLANDWAAGRRLPRNKQSFAISTIRSFLFNQALAGRVQEKTWNQFVPGDIANLNGTRSVFDVLEISDELRQRCREMDVHPAGILAGEGSNAVPEIWQTALDQRRVERGTRSFRLPVQDLTSQTAEAAMVLSFTLERGAFATAVLRELCDFAA
ncbi:MAG: tRNA pseudouridine(13) synthase TruD [Congregibacter sp.]